MDVRRCPPRSLRARSRRAVSLTCVVLLSLSVGCAGGVGMFQSHPAQQPVAQQTAASQPTSAPASEPADPIADWARKMADRRNSARTPHRRDNGDTQHAPELASSVESDQPFGGADEEPRVIRSPQPATQPSAAQPSVTNAPNSTASLVGPIVTSQPAAAAPQSQPTRPPSVSSVTARSDRDFAFSRGAEPQRKAALNSPEKATAIPATLRELLDQLPDDSANDLRGQVHQHLLWAIAGDAEKARRPLQFATRDQQEVCTRFVDAVLALADMSGGRPTDELTAILSPLVDLKESLAHLAELQVPSMEICRAVRGFGQYDTMTPRFVAGRDNEFVLYAEIRDFVSERTDDGQYKSVFGMKVAILNRAGDVVHELAAPEMVDQCRARRSDCFVSPLIRLPKSLSPGEYVVKATISDKIGRKVAERQTMIRLTDR